MASLLSNMDSVATLAPPTRPSAARKRKSSPVYVEDSFDSAPPEADYGFSTYRDGDDYHNGDSSDGAGPSSEPYYSSPLKKVKKAKLEPQDEEGIPASSDGMDLDLDEDDEFDKTFDEIDFADLQFDSTGKVDSQEEKKPLPVKPAPQPTNQYLRPINDKNPKTEPNELKKLEEANEAWDAIDKDLSANTESAEFDSLGPLASASKDIAASFTVDALDQEGNMVFFWLDYLELGGKVHFTGKVFDKGAEEAGRAPWVSCCVVVDGIDRNLFIKPRQWTLGMLQYLSLVPFTHLGYPR